MDGRVLANRYRLGDHLGRGAMGDVYRARHVKVPRMFAVKILLPELVADAKVVARFEREAELAGRLRHRNVTSVIDVGETDGTRFLVMEFAEGTDLGTLMNAQPMEAARAIRLFHQIVEGLEHAHANDVVHRDLKPENVIVESTGDEEIARIVDFGVAILRDGAASSEDRLTTGGLVIGTPHYMAPELATGKAFDHRVDLFALGVILYEMLTGVMPYEGDGVEVALQNLRVLTPPMALRAPHVTVDPLHEALVRKLMAKRVEDRVQTAKEARLLLDLIATDRTAAASALGVELPVEVPAPVAVGAPEPDAPRPVRETSSTRELLALANRRSRWVARGAAVALLLACALVLMIAIDRGGEASAVTLDMAGDDPSAAPADRATANDIAPAPATDTEIAGVGSVPVSYARSAPLARPVEPSAAPPVSPQAADPRTVIDLYQSTARALKAIADRRDMAADDLWQRYRLIRIQDAISDPERRAQVVRELAAIETEIGRRFGE